MRGRVVYFYASTGSGLPWGQFGLCAVAASPTDDQVPGGQTRPSPRRPSPPPG